MVQLSLLEVGETLPQIVGDGHGARQISGIPGDFALPYFRIIEQSKILPLYTLSHEPGVGFAADASARDAICLLWLESSGTHSMPRQSKAPHLRSCATMA